MCRSCADRARRVWRFLTGDRERTRRLLSIVFVLLALSAVTYVVARDWDSLVQFGWQLHWGQIGWALVFFPLGAYPTIYGWHLLVVGLGGPSSLVVNANAFVVSVLPRRLPGVVWYVGTRTLWYRERGVSSAIVLAATVLETLTLGISGLLVYVVAAVVSETLPLPDALYGAAGAAALVVCLLVSPVAMRWLSAKVRRGRWAADMRALDPWRALGVLAVYAVAWVNGGLFLYFLLAGIGGGIPVEAAIGTWALAGAAGMFASLVQGIGLKELTMSAILGGFLPLSVAVGVAVLVRVVHTVAEGVFMLLVLPILRVWTKRG